VNVNALELLSSKSDSNNHKEQQEYIPPGLDPQGFQAIDDDDIPF
ncbi:TPA: single-stranded DNA-binding protein, partial [Clostridioides difficile]|nr:single-stranded DNA-binding protein [Clostridioides difficile]HBE8504967.1 single-stranded DNA-binding protein [Clostridioides difficile]HBF2760027.1 single-stranded DNA-binding protein [Clostridioides difficile]HBF4017263.1 single-stranded DNA-binding protein [Clostridioides difficile]HBF5174207.1 single-stranded DNA-binding protein [Clostridioides difficile]